MTSPKTIRVVAPARPLDPAYRDRLVEIMATGKWPGLTLQFDEQCFYHHNHFAGTDEQRLSALVAAANDPEVDIIWFARGGYGSLRLLPELLDKLSPEASSKAYIGYSDMGFLFGALYREKIGQCVHGPMPGDLARTDGEKAIHRVFDFLSSTGSPPGATPVVAFNLTVLTALIATPYAPDLEGHILCLEDVGEYQYRLDRSMATLHANGMLGRLAGIKPGRFSHVPIDEGDVPFGPSALEIVDAWCRRAGIPLLSAADIGHDVENDLIAFG